MSYAEKFAKSVHSKGREVSRKRKTHDLGSFEPSDMLSPCNHNSSKLHKIAQVSLASQEMETGEQRDICSGTCHLDSTCRQMKQQGKRSRIYNVKGVTKSALQFPPRLEKATFNSEIELRLPLVICAIHSKIFLAKITGKQPTLLNTSSECRQQTGTHHKVTSIL